MVDSRRGFPLSTIYCLLSTVLTLMNRHLALKTLPLWLGVGFYLFFGLRLFSDIQIPEVPFQRNGPILFWQDGAIYTINPDGTDLNKITPALRANQRFTTVSPGCHGLVEAPCMVLVGHVLYHISGASLPLPTLNGTEWLNAPASWSPDGVYLAYPVKYSDTGQRSLLVYNTRQDFLQQAAEDVDESIKPAWSPGCVDASLDNCYLAYRRVSTTGKKGVKVASLNLGSNQTQIWTISSGQGHILKWSSAGQLYYGGNLGWFSVEDGSPVGGEVEAGLTTSLSPAGNYVTYSAAAPSINALQQNAKRSGIWLARVSEDPPPSSNFTTDDENIAAVGGRRSAVVFSKDTPRLIQPPLSSPRYVERGFNHEVFWSPKEDALAAFNGGQLIHYDLIQDQVSIWHETSAMDVLGGYAFSPTGDGLALVEGQFLDNPEKPQHRLFIVYKSGEVMTLRGRTRDPILLLAWLSGDYAKYLHPYEPCLISWWLRRGCLHRHGRNGDSGCHSAQHRLLHENGAIARGCGPAGDGRLEQPGRSFPQRHACDYPGQRGQSRCFQQSPGHNLRLPTG